MEFSVFTTCVETKVLLTVSLNRSVLHPLHPEIYRREDDNQSMTYEVSKRFEELSIDGANGIIAVTFGVCGNFLVRSRPKVSRRRDATTKTRKIVTFQTRLPFASDKSTKKTVEGGKAVV